MSHGFFSTVFYIPLYNALVILMNILPGHNVGLAIIILTILIRLVLFPLSRKAIKTQLSMKRLEPQIAELKKNVTDKQEQARQMLELYRKNDVNPFASLLLLVVQLPILFGLYRVIKAGLSAIDKSLLYSFVISPAMVGTTFLGIDLVGKSIILAALAVITQFIQINLSLPKAQKKKAPAAGQSSFSDDLAQSMNTQMRYIFPLIIFPIAYLSSVLALYFITGNIFMSFQEIFVKRRLARKYETKG